MTNSNTPYSAANSESNGATSSELESSVDRQRSAPVGRHLLADFYGVKAELLRDERALMLGLIDALEASDFHVLDQHAHAFPGEGGVTGMVLLSESHAAFHTYPEFQYVAVDVFSCGMADPAPVIAALTQKWRPTEVRRTLNARGSRDAKAS